MARSTFLVSLLFALFLPAVIEAQSGPGARAEAVDAIFRSRHGHDCCRNWDEFAEICKMQGGSPTKNPAVCNDIGTSPTGTQGSTISLAGSPTKGLAAALIFGAPVGAGAGSFVKDANGNEQWKAGALAGAGGGLLVAVMANSGSWSRPTNAFVMAGAGALIGASVGTAADNAVVIGSAQAATSSSKIGPYAAIGAATGLAAGFTFPGRSRLRLFPNGRVGLLQRGSILGLHIRW